MWQDITMSLVGMAFAVSMLPAVVMAMKHQRVDLPWSTLVITVAGLGAIVVCMASLSYWAAAGTNFSNMLCWGILLAIKAKYVLYGNAEVA